MRKEYDYQKIEVANRAEGVLIEYISCDCGMLAERIRWKRGHWNIHTENSGRKPNNYWAIKLVVRFFCLAFSILVD
ncbi:TPA: hypothetical protein ITS68_002247 [Enterococcus faecalis]|nr:hypothetical protein [Enterococcus faecalis]HAP3008141.1 hypothetical protein [Enterococcus faecalis]